MKKVLLIAMAAMVFGSASAQLTQKKEISSKSQRQQNVALQEKKVSKGSIVVKSNRSDVPTLTKFGVSNKLAKAARGLQDLSAHKSTLKMASRRAGTVQAQYDGYGKEYQGESVNWTMTSGSDGGVLTLTDVIPTIGEESITVSYTLSGNTITIAPQYVGENEYEGAMDYIFLFSGSSNSGDITLTLNDDNSISTDEEILYGAFSEKKFTPATDPDFSNKYTGYYEYIQQISYLLPGQVKAPTVFYEPDGVYLHLGMSPSWYSFNNTLMYLPADATTDFLNYTQDQTDTWSWTMDKLKVNDAGTAYETDETFTSSSASFSVDTEAGSVYYQPILQGSFGGAASEPYQWSVRRGKAVGYVYGGGSVEYTMSDGTLSQVNKCDPANRVTTAAYMGTPTINSQNYNFSSVIFYQGKPAAPLYFEGISLWVGSFTKTADFSLTCKIVKVTRDPVNSRLTLGDVVAQADVDLSDIYLDEDDPSNVWALLNWNNFYVEDEFGLSEDVEYLQISDEFAIVFEGWNNGTFTAVPVIEYSGDRVNTASTTSLYVQQDGNDAVLGFFSNFSKPYVSYKGAVYGWLHTDDSKNVVIPAEGGQVGIHVEPMFSTSDDAGNPATALWLAEDSEEIPEWLTVGFANEVYTSEDYSFDLVFQADALPEGVSGRTASLKFEQWGAKLEVTVSQGETAGISVTKVSNQSANAAVYNLAGQRVNNSFKGLVVKGGKKYLNK